MRAVAAGDDGTRVAIGTDEGVTIRDTRTGQREAGLETGVRPVSLALSPDNRWSLVGTRDGAVLWWEPGTGKTGLLVPGDPTFRRTGAGERPLPMGMPAVAVSGNGRMVSADHEGTVSLWWGANGEPRRNDPTEVDSGRVATALAVSPDGRWIALGHDDGLVRVRADAVVPRPRPPNAGDQGAYVAVPSDGGRVLAGRNGSILGLKLWNLSDPGDEPDQAALAALTGQARYVMTVAAAPTGRWLAAYHSFEDVIRVWREHDGADIRKLPMEHLPSREGHGRSRCMAFSAHGELALGTNYGQVHLWRVETGRPSGTLHLNEESIDLRERPGVLQRLMTRLAPGDREGAGSWPYWLLQAVLPIRFLGDDAVTAVSFIPDGRLVVGSENGRVHLWDPRTRSSTCLVRHGERVREVLRPLFREYLSHPSTLIGHRRFGVTKREGRYPVAVGVSGTRPDVTVAYRDGLILRRRAGTEDFVRLAGPGGEATSLACSVEGYVAATRRDGLVRVWGPEGDGPIALQRTDRELYACAWTPDGHHLVVGGTAGLYLYRFHR
ncbi:hypothetical protein FNQ90_14075 [Streptomyces alkaliphilus]|uniref:WD40 repeat domain-containing protein n=1 Tax=Streptomyces alkaliphilus TaxID=1472722 RepID=A0A7W3Y2D7_9ACTN|nr:hypothetical protein [Streptomyces alkaliphilus]MBB0245202.1 hypothetical protein [Streptomyces alkaliphilus]